MLEIQSQRFFQCANLQSLRSLRIYL